jgi:uncharacterized membrane protein YeaQ/YmgE (transglycosylase-associated protein family)
MAFVWMLLVGLSVGALARLWIDRPEAARIEPALPPPPPSWSTARLARHARVALMFVLAVAGSFIAGFVGRGMGFYDRPGQGSGIVASLLGAVSMIAVYRVVRTHAAH